MKIPQNVHFVGIGGVGVSGLAQHLLKLGRNVSGSDRQENDQTAKLRKLGAKVFVPHSWQNVGNAQLVVRTSAVPPDNEEVQYALHNGIPVVLREQLLGEIFNRFSTRIAVCGTHGKTTVTAMIHHILERCGVGHTAFIGGNYLGQNYFFGQNIVVAEACEYNRSFLYLHPTVCLCLNVEFDHPDCYCNADDVADAFNKLFALSNVVIKQQPDGSFGGLRAQKVVLHNGAARFDLADDKFIAKVRLGVCGSHNVNNALAALAVAKHLGLPLLQAVQAVGTFVGVDRRFQQLPCPLCNVVCDYAHHPTEIATTVATAKNLFCGKIVAVFQPHTYTRTQVFFRQFAKAFDGVDEVVFLPVYSAREKPIAGVSSFGLYRLAKSNGQNAKYFPDFARAAKYLRRTLAPQDALLLVGAGNVNQLADLLQ